MTVKLVCFDLGGVLVQICSSWAQAVSVAGLGSAGPAHADSHARPEMSKKVFALELGHLSPAEFARDVAPLVGRTEHEVHTILDRWLLRVFPGALQLLDELAERGMPVACLSNTNARHWELMSSWTGEADALWPRLTHRFASHELKLRKPDPEIYTRVEAAMKEIARPSEIVFFDDLPDNIAAANARDWRAELVRSKEDPVAEMRGMLGRMGVL